MGLYPFLNVFIHYILVRNEVRFMKIEKINDNQIKCTLNKSDLASRQIKLSELAYGSEKAKSLFRDMMQQASCELGFEAEDIPLMIEAIPVSGDCIVLLITKVEDPEELDTRFSKFAPAADDIEEIDGESKLPSPSGILDMLGQVKDEIKEALEKGEDSFIPLAQTLSKVNAKNEENHKSKDTTDTKNSKDNASTTTGSKNIIKIFSFDSLDPIIEVSFVLKDIYNGANSLYKAPNDNRYFLVVNKSTHTIVDFNKICNIILEYGFAEPSTPANEAFYKEHFTRIIPKKALQKLVTIRA